VMKTYSWEFCDDRNAVTNYIEILGSACSVFHKQRQPAYSMGKAQKKTGKGRLDKYYKLAKCVRKSYLLQAQY
jgi:hypothetical protein